MNVTIEEQIRNAIKWIEALMSGEYTQGVGKLKQFTDAKGSAMYCCWGLGREVLGLEIDIAAEWDDYCNHCDTLAYYTGFISSNGIMNREITWDGYKHINLARANDCGCPFEVIGKHLIDNASHCFTPDVALGIIDYFRG